MLKIKRNLIITTIWVVIIGLLLYSRLVNLDWGLPYPMHPDERNMANALQQLECEFPIFNFQFPNTFQVSNCFNPHFFAYGQFPLYLGYVVAFILKFFDGDVSSPISFEEAVISLRLISAVSSVLNVFVLYKIVQALLHKNSNSLKLKATSLLVFVFSPFFIQFSHFGTTESLLMLLYSSIIFLSIKFSQGKLNSSRFLLISSLLCGIAIASKVSSVLFLVVPLLVLLKSSQNKFYNMVRLVVVSLVFSVIFSPHNFISFQDFLGSMRYESDVGLGNYRAFYTRQFEGTTPILFQLEKILPFALGWPILILSLLGFIFLPFKKEFNLVRFAIIANFLPNAFLYTKWTRFVSPILPLILLLAVLFLYNILNFLQDLLSKTRFRYLPQFSAGKFGRMIIVAVMILIITIPGIAYLSIYQKPDIRFTASEWIYKNISANSLVLSETANVVDLPIISPKQLSNVAVRQFPQYRYISFNFYDLDQSMQLRNELDSYIDTVDYIFVPSRRLFKNHTCLVDEFYESSLSMVIPNENLCKYRSERYQTLNKYYDDLFSKKLGFIEVAKFEPYPKIELFGKTLFEFPDENAEETWTVFDHPVIRIYKRS